MNRACKPGETVETSTQLRPDELGYRGGLWSDFLNLGHTFDKEKPVEGAKFLREPTRATLTEPPTGYRSPSPDQPYGLNYRGEKGKALTQEERQTQGSKDNDAVSVRRAAGNGSPEWAHLSGASRRFLQPLRFSGCLIGAPTGYCTSCRSGLTTSVCVKKGRRRELGRTPDSRSGWKMSSFGSPRRRGCSPARAHPFGQRTVAFRSFSNRISAAAASFGGLHFCAVAAAT